MIKTIETYLFDGFKSFINDNSIFSFNKSCYFPSCDIGNIAAPIAPQSAISGVKN